MVEATRQDEFRELIEKTVRRRRIRASATEEMLLHVKLAHPIEAKAFMDDIFERLA